MPTRLGQNFLKNNEIVASANLKADDLILEIGPGRGILTEELARHAGKIVAVELDKELCNLLRNKFSNNKKVEIIEGDILKINLTSVLGNEVSKYKLVANLPYYITSPIIRMFLESETPPSEMILMVQKEVAERIVARPGQMSILAVSVQYYADAEILFEVGKENFEPVPEVDSCVIKITPRPKTSPGATRHPLPKKGEGKYGKNFFRIVKAGFSAKRKTLVNNLANSLHLDKNIVEEKIKKAGFLPTVRAQELSVSDWKNLTRLFQG
jgi:16S rRNA (adenine1518-N6/adenine1519-N6)-dimethyltransferase